MAAAAISNSMNIEKKQICVAVDIEKAGSNLIRDPVIAVGFVVGDVHGKVLQKRIFKLKVEWPVYTAAHTLVGYGSFEPRCWDEFWSKQPTELIALLHENAAEQEEGWKAISVFIDQLEKDYPEETHKIVFLSDNPSYDIATIDCNLEKYCKRAPMRYSSTGKYRSVQAADDMFDMLPMKDRQEAQETIDVVVTHDHNPVNDAEFIYRQYVAAREYKPKTHSNTPPASADSLSSNKKRRIEAIAYMKNGPAGVIPFIDLNSSNEYEDIFRSMVENVLVLRNSLDQSKSLCDPRKLAMSYTKLDEFLSIYYFALRHQNNKKDELNAALLAQSAGV